MSKLPMKLRNYRRLLSLCLLCILVCSSCVFSSGPKKYTAYSMDYFDTVTTVIGYAESKAEFDGISQEMLSLLGEYHRLYTIYDRYDGTENICTLNDQRAVSADRRIVDLLRFGQEAYDLTGGTVNIAMGSILALWHDCRTNGMNALPSMESLESAAQHTDISRMVIDGETVVLTDPLMKLDVGAVAKGYAVECIAHTMEEKGVTGYILNVGGNIRSIGAKPDGSPWTVGVENPDGEEYLTYLQLRGEAVVTSGSYQRYFIVDGKKYHHIIDPDTLMPAEGYSSVSVICNDSGMGDALSTALFCMTDEDGLALVESLPGTEAMWVDEDGSRTVSSGWSAYVIE